MIYGVGHDLVEIDRIGQIQDRTYWDRFVERVLTEQERKLAAKRGGRVLEFVSGRFAVKEAVVKAFGCGIGDKIGFTDIEVLPDALGKPQCTLTPEAWGRLALDAAAYRIHVSITHQPKLASAFAVVEQLQR